MCGEKQKIFIGQLCQKGSPPHVRGKVFQTLAVFFPVGITPACAGKSPWTDVSLGRATGSPPHVRGKGGIQQRLIVVVGITPACAGKRLSKCALSRSNRDHPRMCGEKSVDTLPVTREMGSPPHVRGKEPKKKLPAGRARITPACAGKRLKRSRSTVPHAAIVPLFPSVCNKPAGSDGSPAGHDAPPFLPIENAAPASPAYNLRSL